MKNNEVFPKKKMGANDIRISLKMKDKTLLSIEKNITKCGKMKMLHK